MEKPKLVPLWNAEVGLCFQLKDCDWLGQNTAQIMRDTCDFLNECLDKAELELKARGVK
jgi:hypothetical protein